MNPSPAAPSTAPAPAPAAPVSPSPAPHRGSRSGSRVRAAVWSGLVGLGLAAGLFGSGCSAGRDLDVGPVLDLSVPPDLRRQSPPDLRPPLDMTAPDVHVVITADNAYAFGWGDVSRVTKLSGRPMTQLAADIFNCPIGLGPEEYDIPAAEAPETSYLYVVAWADDATTQGLIGQFDRGGVPIYTGHGDWEVCATGMAYDTGPAGGGPTLDVVNQEIARCTAGSGSPTQTSAGWVGQKGAITPGAIGALAVGEDNSVQGGDFPIVCQRDATGKRGVDADARWIWYSPDGKSPFRYAGGRNPTRAFLIFRLPSKVIVIG
ncbi:MAG: hypothetical protein U1A78_12500 [Polyangia bacterium]